LFFFLAAKGLALIRFFKAGRIKGLRGCGNGFYFALFGELNFKTNWLIGKF